MLTNKSCSSYKTETYCKALKTNSCKGCKFYKTAKEVEEEREKIKEKFIAEGRYEEIVEKYGGV